MLFNSYTFIFFFLPVVLVGYFWLSKKRLTTASKAWLVFASLFFYSWWNVIYLPLILGSILFNFAVGSTISRLLLNNALVKAQSSNAIATNNANGSTTHKVENKDADLLSDTGSTKPRVNAKHTISPKALLVFGLVCNISLLGYFKYTDFFISNTNVIIGSHIDLLHIVLPLGISFFTFTQIAYLVDAYRGEVKEMDYLNYTLFVTFFPHLLAGPILHHKEMMPQFDNIRSKVLNYKNLSLGLFLFSIGLFKKVVIADTFAVWANAGFDTTVALSLFEAWATSLSYTFQLYFDFSGYTDMALGVALMFNIRLPFNFNSPYKALDIQDFWRRWHITLSRFLRDYIYIPLGGNRLGEFRTYANLFTVFLIGGLWHGASWMFVIWGAMHGAAIVLHRYWSENVKPKIKETLGKSREYTFGKWATVIAWFITFNFINLTWVFFRAKDMDSAINVIGGMVGGNGVVMSENYFLKLHFMRHFIELHPGLFRICNVDSDTVIYSVSAFILVLLCKNSQQKISHLTPSWKSLTFMLTLLVYSIFNLSKVSEFLYFTF